MVISAPLTLRSEAQQAPGTLRTPLRGPEGQLGSRQEERGSGPLPIVPDKLAHA